MYNIFLMDLGGRRYCRMVNMKRTKVNEEQACKSQQTMMKAFSSYSGPSDVAKVTFLVVDNGGGSSVSIWFEFMIA
jgi:hypothetical protein